MSVPSRPLIGWLAACGVLVIWSLWVVISRFGVVQSLTVHDIMALRFFVAVLAVAPFAVRYWPRNLPLWKLLCLSFGPGVPYLLLAFSGMQHAPASHAGLFMNGTLPVFTAVLGWLCFKEGSSLSKVIGMAVILLGCLLVAGMDGNGELTSSAWVGHVLFLSAALVFAGYLVATRLWGIEPLQALVSIPVVNLVWFGPLYVFALPKAIDTAPLSEMLLQGLYQGLGPNVLGVLCFTVAARSIGPARTAAVLAGVPGLAAILAIPVLGEWPGPVVWLGLVLATVGILLAAGLRVPSFVTSFRFARS